MYSWVNFNLLLIIYLAFFIGSYEVFSAIYECWYMENIVGLTDRESGILISVNTFEFYILFMLFGHVFDKFKSVYSLAFGVVLKTLYLIVTYYFTNKWIFLTSFLTINALYKVSLNFCWIVVVKKYTKFNNSRISFYISCLSQDCGIIFIGYLYDWAKSVYKHHSGHALIKHSPAYIKEKLNQSFSILFYGMLILSLIAMIVIFLLSFRKECWEEELEESQQQMQEQNEINNSMNSNNNISNHNKEQLLNPTNVSKSEIIEVQESQVVDQNKTDLSVLNPENVKNEYLNVLSNPDFNKILVVYILSGISIVFKRNFYRFFYYYTKYHYENLEFRTLSIVGIIGFLIYVFIENLLNLQETSKKKIVYTILLFMCIQQIGFVCLIFIKSEMMIYTHILIVFTCCGVIFSNQKRHQLYLSADKKEFSTYSMMVLPSLMYKSFEGVFVTEMITKYNANENIIWITFIVLLSIPIVVIFCIRNWLIKEEGEDNQLEKEGFEAKLKQE